jgi:signal transduction histidine kinase
MSAVEFQAAQKKIKLVRSVDTSPSMVRADPEKTSWVLINFLTNAIRYTPEGSNIEIAIKRNGRDILFSVQDRGKGIDEKYLSKIFDRYFKVPGDFERSGTGLGLAISKEFIEAQGGKIWAESTVGEGSRFSFSLPAA